MREEKNNRSIVKAVTVINLLAQKSAPMSLAAIAAELGQSKSTVHGILATLANTGFLVQTPETSQYQLGIRLFEIGNRVAERWKEKKIAYPFITLLVEETKETVHLAVLDNDEVLYIAKQESSDSIKTVSEIGIRLPSHCSGVGKILLSGLSKYDLARIAKKTGLKKYTENTITNFEALCREIELIRKQGFAVDNQEHTQGLRCVAVPIRNHLGRVTAALSISAPVSRLRGEVFEKNKSSLIRVSREVSHQLGYTGTPTY